MNQKNTVDKRLRQYIEEEVIMVKNVIEQNEMERQLLHDKADAYIEQIHADTQYYSDDLKNKSEKSSKLLQNLREKIDNGSTADILLMLRELERMSD